MLETCQILPWLQCPKTCFQVGDVMVELDGVPTVGRGPRPKAKAKLGRDLVKQQMLETQRCAGNPGMGFRNDP